MNGTLLLGSYGRLAAFIRNVQPEVRGYDRDTLDITDKTAVCRLLERERPPWIINCAAITDVEYCEKHPQECWAVNAEAVKTLAEASEAVNAKLIHFSSNYAIDPINEYGKAKRASEEFASKKGLVLRTDLYDKNTFVIRKLLFTDEPLEAYEDRFFNPIYMGTMANIVFELKNETGVKNIGTRERLSVYEFALKVCEVFHIDRSRVHSIPSAEEPGRARRPKEIYLKPDVDIPLLIDLQRFKHELEKQKNPYY